MYDMKTDIEADILSINVLVKLWCSGQCIMGYISIGDDRSLFDDLNLHGSKHITESVI